MSKIKRVPFKCSYSCTSHRSVSYTHLDVYKRQVRKLLAVCRATVGVVGNEDHGLVNYGKAGRMRWKGVKPTVRGSVMNLSLIHILDFDAGCTG